MNHDSDIECTCDVGVFASCPACRRTVYEEAAKPLPEKPLLEKYNTLQHRYNLVNAAFTRSYKALRIIESSSMDGQSQEIARAAMLYAHEMSRKANT